MRRVDRIKIHIARHPAEQPIPEMTTVF
jgi:hypothetical protein